MPRYKNVTNKPITITSGLISRTIKPNEELETFYILDNIEGLKRISDQPYYNPVAQKIDLSFSATHNTKVVDIEYHNMPSLIRISNVTVPLDIYFNDETNTPALSIEAGDVITISNPNVFERLILKTTASGGCRIHILKQEL